MNPELPDCIKIHFPAFYQNVQDGRTEVFEVKPGISEAEIQKIELNLGLPLPDSFRTFLACITGLVLDRPVVQMSYNIVWEHPTGTLCFADYFWEADGDQVVFDISKGLIDGEYPVMYYAHDFAREENKGLRKIANSFAEWFNGLRSTL